MQTSKFHYQRKRININHFFLIVLILLFFDCAPNHYVCYKDTVQQPPVGADIVLKDQFRTIKTKVLDPHSFYNPVEKTVPTSNPKKPEVSKIVNKDHHLTGYHIEMEESKIRNVWVKNQFSKKWQKLIVHQAGTLLVPTQKISPKNHKPPKNLDHYVCYDVEGEDVVVVVSLKDQFQKYEDLPLMKPVMLCNPVQKTHKGKVFPIKNKIWHLVGYELDHNLNKSIPVVGKNQFRVEEMRLNNLDLILVPSLKDTVFRARD